MCFKSSAAGYPHFLRVFEPWWLTDTRNTVQLCDPDLDGSSYFHKTKFPLKALDLRLRMSDAIQHECGLALIRLRKPLSYYQQTYGSVMWGLNKLYLLMEKQHNRGQDGAGVAS